MVRPSKRHSHAAGAGGTTRPTRRPLCRHAGGRLDRHGRTGAARSRLRVVRAHPRGCRGRDSSPEALAHQRSRRTRPVRRPAGSHSRRPPERVRVRGAPRRGWCVRRARVPPAPHPRLHYLGLVVGGADAAADRGGTGVVSPSIGDRAEEPGRPLLRRTPPQARAVARTARPSPGDRDPP